MKFEEGSIEPVSEYRPLDKKELRELAFAVRSGVAVGSWSIPEDLISTVFMPIMFMNDLQIKEMERDGIVHFYSYVDENHSFQRGVNGYPMFHSVRSLNRDDFERVREEIKRIEEFMNGD